MKTKLLFKSATFFMLSAVVLVLSCTDEEDRITVKDTQDLTEEAVTDSYFQDMDDMAAVAIQSDEATNSGRVSSGGRIITTIQDDRFKCSGIVVTIEASTESTQENPKGIITVDFGTTGCTDLRGNIRTGKLIFSYNGRRFQPNATVVTTTENYTINGIKLEGIRTLTNKTSSTVDAPEFNIKLNGGKATFKDGSVATRTSDITTKWIRAANPVDDKLVVAASSWAEGTTRGGRNYDVTVIEDMEFKRFCGAAVKGIKQYIIDGGKPITIDYGDGNCDKSFVISVNGVTRTLSAD